MHTWEWQCQLSRALCVCLEFVNWLNVLWCWVLLCEHQKLRRHGGQVEWRHWCDASYGTTHNRCGRTRWDGNGVFGFRCFVFVFKIAGCSGWVGSINAWANNFVSVLMNPARAYAPRQCCLFTVAYRKLSFSVVRMNLDNALQLRKSGLSFKHQLCFGNKNRSCNDRFVSVDKCNLAVVFFRLLLRCLSLSLRHVMNSKLPECACG